MKKSQPYFPDPADPHQYLDFDRSKNIPGSVPKADFFNGVQNEIVAGIEIAGLTPSADNSKQLAEALLLSATIGDFYVVSAESTANVLKLQPVTFNPESYQAGQKIRFFSTATNSGAVRIQIKEQPEVSLLSTTGQELTAEDLKVGIEYSATYTGSAFQLFAGGSGNSFSLPLFFFHHFDSLQNDSSWLRADTFSWQSGEIHWAAYNQLTEEFAGTTATTKTVADIAITFYRTATGKKICLLDQESQIMALYAITGAAWYYILDAENKRFKLPRNSKYVKGVGKDEEVGEYVEDRFQEHKHKFFIGGQQPGSYPAKEGYFIANNAEPSANSITGTIFTNSVIEPISPNKIVRTGSETQPRAITQYLYFYVGNTVHDAQDIYAGKALEQLAGKADIDFNNIDAIGKNKLWGDLSVGYENDKIPTLPRGGEYTAPSNGCIACYHGINGNSVRILFGESDYPVSSAYTVTTESNGCSWRMKKGQKVKISYSGNQANVIVYFFPQGD